MEIKDLSRQFPPNALAHYDHRSGYFCSQDSFSTVTHAQQGQYRQHMGTIEQGLDEVEVVAILYANFIFYFSIVNVLCYLVRCESGAVSLGL
jgi:hypothetical protein